MPAARGDRLHALLDFVETLKRKPDQADAHFSLGAICLKEQDYDKAILNLGKGHWRARRSACSNCTCAPYD